MPESVVPEWCKQNASGGSFQFSSWLPKRDWGRWADAQEKVRWVCVTKRGTMRLLSKVPVQEGKAL